MMMTRMARRKGRKRTRGANDMRRKGEKGVGWDKGDGNDVTTML